MDWRWHPYTITSIQEIQEELTLCCTDNRVLLVGSLVRQITVTLLYSKNLTIVAAMLTSYKLGAAPYSVSIRYEPVQRLCTASA
jgi:hypothetical protein